MTHAARIWSFCLLICLFAGCGSSPKPKEEKSPSTYRHSREYILEVMQEVMKEKGKVDHVDQTVGEIRSAWVVQLSPQASSMTTFGRRTRVSGFVEAAPDGGYLLRATEETERNTNYLAPQDESAAEWSPMENEGVQAANFLQRVHYRLNPRETWRLGTEEVR